MREREAGEWEGKARQDGSGTRQREGMVRVKQDQAEVIKRSEEVREKARKGDGPRLSKSIMTQASDCSC